MYRSLEDFSLASHYLFPVPFVWWTKIENHLEIKEKYLPLINQDYELNKDAYDSKSTWSCLVTSSYFNAVPIFPLFDNSLFNTIIWNPLDTMLEELSVRVNLPIPNQSIVTHAWYNKYDIGSWQEIHDHSPNTGGSETFSGIYLLDVKEKNSTVFYQQNSLRCFSPGKSHYFSTENIEEGYVIIFPSELAHFVKPSVNSRTTISFNISSDYGDVPSN